NLNLVPMDGGHKSVGVGLTCYETLRSHHNPKTILESWSFMDPDRSALAKSCNRIGKIVNQSVRVFTIETTINNDMFGTGPLSFLQKNEDDWNAADELAFKAANYALEKLPRAAKRAFFMKIPANYGVTGVHAGSTDAVHVKTLENCFKQYAVPVSGQADILVSGVPYVCPYNVNSILNPLLVHCTALGYFFNLYRGKEPLLRKGGVIIITHPLYDEFDPDVHPSYIEFFHRLLTETRDSKVLEHDYEERFAREPSYIHMFRTGKAYHPVHPFYMWYWGEAGRAHSGKVIVVGPESRRCAEILGWDVAPTLDDAFGEARAFLGKQNPQITVLHHPPILLADMK
ncbi:MAG TPA: transcriptional regulator, partial [Planctomycetota bacterium]|nr:transcriptional regulator [Planctomycetota bacterium]